MYLINIFIISAAISWILIFVALKVLKYLNVKQYIREEGPKEHNLKAGTPTMGGIPIIISITVLCYIFTDLEPSILILLFLLIGFGIVGFVDDYIKNYTGNNLGLLAWQKSISQLGMGIIFCVFIVLSGHNESVTGILRFLHLNNIFLYIPLILFILVGSSNALNLTDGLDGLLAGTGIISFISFAIISLLAGHEDIAVICVISAASLFSFLMFNRYPAKLFMGDAGSLGLGALLGGVAILSHNELLLIIIGGVFFVETLSVILQVASCKIRSKRIFKMAPLHHHFELTGLKENQVVLRFWAVALILGIIGTIIGVVR